VQNYQIASVPVWADTLVYTVEAKTEGDSVGPAAAFYPALDFLHFASISDTRIVSASPFQRGELAERIRPLIGTRAQNSSCRIVLDMALYAVGMIAVADATIVCSGMGRPGRARGSLPAR
jgi:hypothetical protein